MKNTTSQTKGLDVPMAEVLTGRQCVWAAAGMIEQTRCVNGFYCTTCPVDKNVQQDIARGVGRQGQVAADWRSLDNRIGRPYAQRKCRHMVSGRVPFKYCVYNYECSRCPYDQLIEEDLACPPLGASGHNASPRVMIAGD
jgi:hypothetical protein